MDLDKAMKNPGGAFGTPEALYESGALTAEQKRAVLLQWKDQLQQLQAADDEGMLKSGPAAGTTAELLARVTSTLCRIDAQATCRRGRGAVRQPPALPPGDTAHSCETSGNRGALPAIDGPDQIAGKAVGADGHLCIEPAYEAIKGISQLEPRVAAAGAPGQERNRLFGGGRCVGSENAHAVYA